MDYTQEELKLASELTNWDQNQDGGSIDPNMNCNPYNFANAAPVARKILEFKKNEKDMRAGLSASINLTDSAVNRNWKKIEDLQKANAVAEGQCIALKEVAIEQGKQVVALQKEMDDLRNKNARLHQRIDELHSDIMELREHPLQVLNTPGLNVNDVVKIILAARG